MDDPELRALREKRMAEMQQQSGYQPQQMAQQQQAEEQEARAEAQRQAILRQILTPEARDRMANVKLADPQHAGSVEMQLIQLAQSGRLQKVITDDMLKEILRKVAPKRREINIERR
ncbi:MAG TPA: DNA-binding protein [Candidatus Methanomethylophilaceae archaeon]|nr:DNA-binding protein [Candidatus Methanomethylophilaceae archaeon]